MSRSRVDDGSLEKTMSELTAFAYYLDLLRKIDEYATTLTRNHPDLITCHAGCCECCVGGLTVFPVEAEVMRRGLRLLGPAEQKSLAAHLRSLGECGDDDPCPLLVDGLCGCYDSRPILCRTHGLPVRFIAETEVVECDICPHNLGDEEQSLREEEYLDLDHLNFLLVTINFQYLKDTGKCHDRLRIPIHELMVETLPGSIRP